MNCTTTPTTANSASKMSHSCQPPSTPCSRPASRSAAPLCFMAAPSGMAPATNRYIGASIARYAWRGLRQRVSSITAAPASIAMARLIQWRDATAIVPSRMAPASSALRGRRASPWKGTSIRKSGSWRTRASASSSPWRTSASPADKWTRDSCSGTKPPLRQSATTSAP